MFMSFSGSSTKGAEGRETHFQVGQPSPWLTWDSGPSGFESMIHFTSWSLLIAVAGLCVLALTRRLEYWEKGRVHSMVWHYAVWGVAFAVVFGLGIMSHILGSRPT
jgi:hypothetical protein